MIVVGTAPRITVRQGPGCRSRAGGAEADSVPRGGFGHRQTIKHYIPAGTGAAPPPTSSSSSSLFSSSSSDSSCIDPGSAICQLLQAADPCHSGVADNISDLDRPFTSSKCKPFLMFSPFSICKYSKVGHSFLVKSTNSCKCEHKTPNNS